MGKYDTVKNVMIKKSSDNVFIITRSRNLVIRTEIDAQNRVINNEYERCDGYSRLYHLPVQLDNLVALRNHLSKIILGITLPSNKSTP
jgi:hypothetical protein